MRTLRIRKIANYIVIIHQILLTLLSLADLGVCIFLYLTLTKPALLLNFRVRLLLSGLPRDLRKSVYSLYKSYVETNLGISNVLNLLPLFREIKDKSGRDTVNDISG